VTTLELTGTAEPRIKSLPPATASLGDQAIEFAAKAGLHLDPWQQVVLRGALGVAPGGKWAAPQVGLLCPRQNGKGSVLEALELFHLFALGTELIIHSAHKFDTSQEHFLRMRILIDGNPDLAKHVRATPVAPGKEAIILNNGHRLKFKARTISGSGRGFSSDLLILDEAMVLPEQALDAMLPTLVTRKNPQTWFTSSAGMPESTALWRIVKRADRGGLAARHRPHHVLGGPPRGPLPRTRDPGAIFPEPPIAPFPGADMGGFVTPRASPDTALTVPTVWACVSPARRLGVVAAAGDVPPHLRPDGGAEAHPGPVADHRPTTTMTQSEWLHMLMVSLLLRGNGIRADPPRRMARPVEPPAQPGLGQGRGRPDTGRLTYRTRRTSGSDPSATCGTSAG
jgi:hypothetical protein